MIRFAVGEVVEAGVCPRRFVLRRSGAPVTRPQGTPVGAIVHRCVHAFVERAASDDLLRKTLTPALPAPDEVAGRATQLMDELFLERISDLVASCDVSELERAGRALRELGRLLSTLLRRARVAGAAPQDAVHRAIPAVEKAFTLTLDTREGPAEMTGRIDLLARNDVDRRFEVWELKTYTAEESTATVADEQAALYALALQSVLQEPETVALRPAVLHVTGDGRVTLRAVPGRDEQDRSALIDRIVRMHVWSQSLESVPPTGDLGHCVDCPVQSSCWQRYGATLPEAAAAATSDAIGGAVARSAGADAAGPAPRAAGRAPISVLIGHDEREREVRWQPNHQDRPLENFGFLVTGDAGQGKTQTLRAIVAAVRVVKTPVLVFDFKNDFSARELVEPAAMTVHDVADHGLPYNPLSLIPDDRSQVHGQAHIHQVASVFQRVFGLGDQQKHGLKRALQASYRARGVPLEPMRADRVIPGPSFSDVIEAIEGPANLRPRIDGLTDLGLLRGGESVGDVDALLNAGLVLSLHRVADQRLANALVELSLVVIHARLLAGNQPRRLTRLLVLDEAHRVARSEKLVTLLREGRAFGVGAAVGTQYPGDLPDELQGALATKLFLRNDQDAHITAVARHLGASGSGLVSLKEKLRRLDRLEGMLVNAHHRPYARVRVLPHHARSASR